MRTGVLCSGLLFLTALGACGDGTPQEVTTFKLGPDGRPLMGTAKVEHTVDRREFALVVGLAYTWDCQDESQDMTFGKEAKFCGDTLCHPSTTPPPFPTESCVGFGAGGNDAMFISLSDFTWPAGSYSVVNISGLNMYTGWRPKSARAVAANYPIPPTHHSEFEVYVNDQGGGGCSSYVSGSGGTACLSDVPNGYSVGGVFHSQQRPGSFELVRRCGPGATPC